MSSDFFSSIEEEPYSLHGMPNCYRADGPTETHRSQTQYREVCRKLSEVPHICTDVFDWLLPLYTGKSDRVKMFARDALRTGSSMYNGTEHDTVCELVKTHEQLFTPTNSNPEKSQ